MARPERDWDNGSSWVVYVLLFIVPPLVIVNVFGLDRWYGLLWIILAFAGLWSYLSQEG